MTERPSRESFIDGPEDFSRVMKRARDEGWTQLALIRDPAGWRWLEKDGWGTKTSFVVRALPDNLLEELATVRGIRALLVHGLPIGSTGARAIAEHLSGLTSLNLRGNDIGDEGARAIAEHLSGLTSLNLRGNNIGDEGARAIAEHLSGLTSLHLGNNSIGDEGARAIAEHLSGLTSLHLGDNRIGDEGAGAVAEHLSGLTSLDLHHNSIGAEGAGAIAVHLSGLTSLDLSHNRIGDEGARAIAEHLSGLTSLDLGNNSIGDEGARAIAEHLSGLTSLHLGNNSIGAEGAGAIAEHLSGLTSLDLGNNSIGDEGARAIAEHLSGLTSLHLGDKSIGDEGARAIAEHLSGLTSLHLSSSSIGDEGARAIAEHLSGLTSLHLGNNSIGAEGARAIAEHLSGLTSLSLDWNSIGDEGARGIAEHLSGLTSLGLGGNRIGDEGAREIAEHLSGLTSLGLSGNGIGDEGARAIAEHLSGLTSLDLTHNFRITIFPAELLYRADARAIRAAYRRLESSKSTPLNEAKLLVLGNEAVGKTSLIRYLVRDQARDPDERKTPGIAVHERIETLTWSPSSGGPSLNVWDFGGQEIMHETHKFFLTQRSIYLLVLEDRREDDTSVYNWLRTIANRGEDSPVLVVINKCDDDRPKLLLDETHLRREWPFIAGFLRTSCDATDHARASIRALRTTIASLLADDPRLARVRDPFPVAWRRVKDAIAEQAKRAKILDHLAFIRLCESAEGEDAITDPDEQRGLLGVLHELGVVVAHGLAPDAPAVLQQIKLLDPNWLTGAVYRVLTAAQLVHQGGVFKRQQLAELLDPDEYPPERWEFVLSLMKLEGVGLCFPLRDSDDAYLVPEALPKSEPYYANWPPDSLRFRYQYEFLPPGLIPRFIVEAHPRLTTTRWREGAILKTAECSVLVHGNRDRRRIDILVDGPEKQRRSALEVVRADLDRVHALNPESKPTPRVPLPDNPEVSVSYQHLRNLEELKGSAYEYIPDGTRSSYRVGDLLDGIRTHSPARKSPSSSSPPSSGSTPGSSWADAKLRELKRSYTGIWGLKVFALAAVTLAPLYINFKQLDLHFSVATLVYGAYHAVAVYCWGNVRQLTRQPELFEGEEREAEIKKIATYARVASVLGGAVLFVLSLTAIAVGSVVWGDSTLKAPLPSVVYKALGVPER